MQLEPQHVPLEIDRDSPVPLYFQLAAGFEAALAGGALRPGDRIENELELASRLGLSRPTVRQAIQELVDKGLLVRKRGVGTQVIATQVSRPVKLSSLFDDLKRAGKNPTTRVLEYRIGRPSPESLSRLGDLGENRVLEIKRLRCADGEPLALMTNYLPERFAVTLDELETTGLYAALAERGVSVRVARQTIGARAAHGEEVEVLGENEGAPLLTMDRTSYDAEGRVIEFGHHLYRASTYSFEMTLVDSE